MNMIRIAPVLIGLLAFCAGCQNAEEKETPSGLKYTIVKKGDGTLPKKDDMVLFDFVMKDSKDSVWNDTYEGGMPGVVMIADTSALGKEDGMTQMFRSLSKGDSVVVSMTVGKFFKDLVQAPVPPSVDSTLSISYLIKVTDIMSKDSFRELQPKLMEAKAKKQINKDEKSITDYLQKNNITAERDSSGIHYVIHKTNEGSAKPEPGSCVEVEYAGKFLKTEEEFDKNDRIAFPLTGVIKGWQLAIPKLGIGDSATFYIPSALAYGPQGYPGAIPPDAILIFDVELLGIGKEFDRETRTCK